MKKKNIGGILVIWDLSLKKGGGLCRYYVIIDAMYNVCMYECMHNSQ